MKFLCLLLLFLNGYLSSQVIEEDTYRSQLFWCAEEPPQEVRRIYVDMVADLFHPGHVAFLKKVKALGGCLIVGLTTDEDCEGYKRRPILTFEERLEMVKSCRYVDAVLLNAPFIVNQQVIDELNIELVVHGDDFSQEQVEMYYQVPSAMGIFQTVSYTPGISTTELINRIQHRMQLGSDLTAIPHPP